MATLTIRNVDEKIKSKLREKAARNGISMEEQVRRILIEEFAPEKKKQGFATYVREKMAELGIEGAELEIPPREIESSRPIVDFAGFKLPIEEA